MNNIITLSGDPGSGKSTVRNALQTYFEKEGKKVIIYYVGDIFRQLADEKGMTVTEFNKFLQKNNCDVDKTLDDTVKKMGIKVKQENDPNKIYIFDSRMAWKNIPSAYKVRLTITDQVAAERIFNDKTRGKEDRYTTLEEAITATKTRKKSEKERYLKLYGEDITLPENFDININTAFVSPEEIANAIINDMKLDKPIRSKSSILASPKLFLPSQELGDSIHTFDKIEKSIQKNGYNMAETINAMKKEGMYFVLDGHHRSFAAASLGYKLLPYYIEDEDTKEMYSLKERRDIIKKFLERKYYATLHTYEEAWREKKTGKLTYTYEEAYPGIYGIQQDTEQKNVGQER